MKTSKKSREKELRELKSDPDYAHLDIYQIQRVIDIKGKKPED
jgi:hypothetical protein